MPTYLRTVCHLSATSTGGFLLVQVFAALCGFLLGSYLSDAVGRKWTFLRIKSTSSFLLGHFRSMHRHQYRRALALGVPPDAEELFTPPAAKMLDHPGGTPHSAPHSA